MDSAPLAVRRVLLPLGPEVDEPRLILAAGVLASWFDAPIQIACAEPDRFEHYQDLAGGLGLPVERVVCLDEPFTDGLVTLAQASAPALVVADDGPLGRDLARAATQPVLIVAERAHRRLPLGPLVVEQRGGAGDLDTLAVAATFGRALDQPVRLIPVDDLAAEADDGPDRIREAEARLRQMGCDVGVDRIESRDEAAVIVAARSRGAVAILVGQDGLDRPEVVDLAIELGLNVLVAPAPPGAAERPAPFDVGLDRPLAPTAPVTSELENLDRSECLRRLESHTLARLGYVSAGLPTVVPVNYRFHDGDVLIRSLAGGKVQAAERNDAVCLELDGFDEGLRSGWSVVVHGRLEEIGDPAVLRRAWANDPQPWVSSQEWHWLRLVPFSMSGRRVVA
jgi:hypothetical protein